MITVATITRREMITSRLPLMELVHIKLMDLPRSPHYYLSPTSDGETEIQLPEREYYRLVADREKPSELLERF